MITRHNDHPTQSQLAARSRHVGTRPRGSISHRGDSVLRTKRRFEVSVDTRTKGRKLDGYTRRRTDGHEMLLDPDLLKLPVELTITTRG
jgi:hypothetical protein